MAGAQYPQNMFLSDLRAALPWLQPSASCSFLWNTDSSKLPRPGKASPSLCTRPTPGTPCFIPLEGGKTAPIDCGL